MRPSGFKLQGVSDIWIVSGVSAFCAVLFAVAWLFSPSVEGSPYLKIAGRGFIFNYRIGEVFYGFTAVVVHPLPTGSIIEAIFEDPGGGEKLTVRQRVGTETNRYAIRSPAVRGVVGGKPYSVMVRVFDREETNVLWTTSISITSQIGDDGLAEKPLTIGPGYAPNPDR